MRFLFIGSRFTLRTSFPRSVTLTQLYFASLVVTNLRRDLHPQVCAHAERTIKKPGFPPVHGEAQGAIGAPQAQAWEDSTLRRCV